VQAWKRDAERFTATLSVLRNLEQACDDLAAARTRDGYLLEVASGREGYLIELDDARRAARAAIDAAMEK